MKRVLTVIGVGLLIVGWGLVALPMEEMSQTGSTIVAVVEGEPVTLQELEAATHAGAGGPTTRREALEQAVRLILLQRKNAQVVERARVEIVRPDLLEDQ